MLKIQFGLIIVSKLDAIGHKRRGKSLNDGLHNNYSINFNLRIREGELF